MLAWEHTALGVREKQQGFNNTLCFCSTETYTLQGIRQATTHSVNVQWTQNTGLYSAPYKPDRAWNSISKYPSGV